MWLNEDHAEKKMYYIVISRSSKVNQGHLGLLSFLYPYCENMKMNYKDTPILSALNLTVLAHLAP